MYDKVRSLLFKLQPERAHSLAERFLRYFCVLPGVQDVLVQNFVIADSRLANDILGLHFPNPLGLPAGFDKNAMMIEGLSMLGFGFLEVGTITQTPQSGNPKPRLFRFPKEKSLQNCMGFNNQGVLSVAKRLKKITPFAIPLGLNLGKNKIIAQRDSLKNYENTLKELLEYGDYFVFNVSSPNTPKLRDLQNKEFISSLCKMARNNTQKPVFIKLSPDMHDEDLLEVIESAYKNGCNGIIATNTTIDYSLLEGARNEGGLSGQVLKEKSREVFASIAKEFFGKLTLVSVGGIDDAKEAYERIKMGASLIQAYTGFVYKGPSFAKDINEGILELMQKDGFNHISEAIGVDYKKGKETREKSVKTESKATKTKKPKESTNQINKKTRVPKTNEDSQN